MKNNSLDLRLNTVRHPAKITVGDMGFSNSKFIEMKIDDMSVINGDYIFDNTLVYWDELFKSSIESGRYLIFTSANGIADEGGWDYVDVHHIKDEIEWLIVKDGKSIKFSFNTNEYINNINSLKNQIKKSDDKLPLEPVHIIFPE